MYPAASVRPNTLYTNASSAGNAGGMCEVGPDGRA